MKIAWFTPYRRGGSGIANYSAAACGALRRGHEVVVFAPDVGPARPAGDDGPPVVALDDLGRDEVLRHLAGFDRVVYNLGDNVDYHRTIYEYSRLHPGIVVLHDLVMRDFFAGYYLRPGGEGLPALLRLMAYCHGPEAAEWMGALAGGRIADYWADPHLLEYHMARAAVGHARGVVVHSEFCRTQLAPIAGAPLARVHFPPPPLAGAALRWEPPADDGGPLKLLTFGYINSNKCVHTVLRALGVSPALRDGVEYTVAGPVGDPSYRDLLLRTAADCGVAHAVRLVGHQDDASLHEAIRAAHVLVNLRNPHFGESSWSLLEAMFAGKPTVVWDHGSYAEFPDGVLLKVSSPAELTAALELMHCDPQARRVLGEQARRHAEQTFAADRYCADFVGFAEAVEDHRAALDLTDRVAHRIREMSAGPGSLAFLGRVADELGLLAGS